ncbi:MAG: HEAT repeat domain-containing protein [Actinomycetota bacterium]|nr:HEAT repeat domain-containing protein [Actinomycetota bacterium]
MVIRRFFEKRKLLRNLAPGEEVILPWEDFSDPELKKEIEQARPAFEAAERAVVEDLRKAGLEVRSVYDLFGDLDYRAQVPVLVDWLGRTDDVYLKEMLVRAMGMPWAKPAAIEPLFAEFRNLERSDVYRWAAGNAIDMLHLGRSAADELIELALDRRYGRARKMVVEALGRTGSPEALEPLVSLLDDDQVAGHATVGLRRLGMVESRPHLERMLDHPQDWVRAEAKRGLRKLDKRFGNDAV